MTSVPSAGGLAAQVLALAEDLHRLRGQLGDLAGIGEQVTALVDDVTVLQEQVAELLAETDVPGRRVWDWSTMNTEQAAVAWRTLLDWVQDILTDTYGLVGYTGGRQDKIPPCWYRHPDAVAELSWLCQEWHRVYRSSKGTPAAAGEWHDRWLPGTITRLRTSSTLARCAKDEHGHVEPKQGQSIDDDSGLAAVVEADIAARPEPVPNQPPG